MNKIFKIFSFEYETLVKNKSFIISVAIMCLVSLGATFIPRFTSNKEENKKSPSKELNEKVEITTGYYNTILDEEIIKNLDGLNEKEAKKYDSLEKMKEDIKKEKIEKGYNFIDNKNLEIISLNNTGAFGYYNTNILKEYNRNKFLKDKNIDIKELNNIENDTYNEIPISLKKDTKQFFFLGYIAEFILYFIILTYGITTATNIAREKNDRTMELLITSTTSKNLILGKVLASVAAGLTALTAMLLSATTGYFFNEVYLGDQLKLILSQALTVKYIALLLIYMGLGSFMYFMLYAVCGSLVNKVEDVQHVIGPAQMLIVLAFVVAMFGLSNPEHPLIKVASYIPLTSPFLMILRLSVSDVTFIEYFLSISILLLTTIIITVLCIKMYRNTTLNYGNKLNFFKEILKLFNKKEKIKGSK